MFRASSLLRNTRLDKELDLSEVSKRLKIPLKYLEALENENESQFPQEPYCSLIVKDYADFLGLKGQEILWLFRRDYEQKRKPKSKEKRNFFFTPQITFSIAIVFTVTLFISYLFYEYVKFNQAPRLKVNWPQTVTSISSLEINGTTDPEATVRINQDLVIVDINGNFQKKINLTNSEEKIVIESKAPNGKTTVEEKVIKVD